MGGGSQPGSGSPQEASVNHQGPPPAAAGASHVKRCNDCGKVCSDGGALDEHMRKEHMVRANRNDVTVPAALIFIDALGDSLPFKQSFTFKELNDFCLREGVAALSDGPMGESDLLKIAEHVELLTNHHIAVRTEPTVATSRAPLSLVDLNVADRRSMTIQACKRCGDPAPAGRVLCGSCRDHIAAQTQPARPLVAPIHLYAHVTLADGTRLHVVDIEGDRFIGVDDRFASQAFTAAEATHVVNMTDDIRTLQAARCETCGEEGFEFASKCANCGQPR